MLKKLLFTASLASVLFQGDLSGHCQMPCGIYHDDMVYNLIDQYVETMYKGVSVLKDNKFSTPQERNVFIRWVMEKDKASDQTANLITEYFLQQKIKVGGDDTAKQLVAAHRLLFMLMTIKQNTDIDFVNKFADEWEDFKHMFHRVGYACEMEKINLKRDEAKRGSAEKSKSHSHDHSHDHDDDHDDDHVH